MSPFTQSKNGKTKRGWFIFYTFSYSFGMRARMHTHTRCCTVCRTVKSEVGFLLSVVYMCVWRERGWEARKMWLNWNGTSVHSWGYWHAQEWRGRKGTSQCQSWEKRNSYLEMFWGQSPRAYVVAWKGSGYQKSRVNHKPRGTWPGFEQRRPFPQAKRVRKRGQKMRELDWYPPTWRGTQKRACLSVGRSGCLTESL